MSRTRKLNFQLFSQFFPFIIENSSIRMLHANASILSRSFGGPIASSSSASILRSRPGPSVMLAADRMHQSRSLLGCRFNPNQRPFHSSAVNTYSTTGPNGSVSEAPENALSVTEIRQLLDEGAVDYRDCFEKAELINRLRERRETLPAHVQNRLQALIQARGPGGAQNGGAMIGAPMTDREIDMLASGLFLDEQNTIALFKRASPSVCHIHNVVTGFNPMTLNIDSMQAGSGSGFIWDREGHVVTNYHVIAQAQKLTVTLCDNKAYEAEIRGVCKEKDIAVLRLRPGRFNASALYPISIGSSSNLQVGQKVFALGNPFGLDTTLTQGIVSGLNREVRGVAGNQIRGVVQTDAAINPGNSGGALLDSRGRLIGVNTMIYSTSGSSAGIGFAIPSDTVRRVVNQLIKFGRVKRPGLGVFMASKEQAGRLGVQEGALVMSVVQGSGAAAAGLQGTTRDAWGSVTRGDVVVAVGAEKITTGEDLVAAVEKFDIGDTISLDVKTRDGSLKKVSVVLQDMVAEM